MEGGVEGGAGINTAGCGVGSTNGPHSRYQLLDIIDLSRSERPSWMTGLNTLRSWARGLHTADIVTRSQLQDVQRCVLVQLCWYNKNNVVAGDT